MNAEHDPRPSPLAALIAALIDAAAEWSILAAGLAISIAGGIAEARHAVADGFDVAEWVLSAWNFLPW